MVIFKNTGSPSIVGAFEDREILYAFHDIDGTHSLIRDWPPVMSIVLHYVSEGGVPDGYDSDENLKKIIELTGSRSRINHLSARFGDVRSRHPDLSTASRELGWQPKTSLTEGLKRTIKYVEHELASYSGTTRTWVEIYG
jgi:hypothetical protein